MPNQARVIKLNEVTKRQADEWTLSFQWCRYEYSNGQEESGFRFIWYRPNGKLQGARGQARIPAIADILELTSLAMRAGWGNNVGPSEGHGNSEE